MDEPDPQALAELLPTRPSLLSRLKRWDDQESWRRFFDTYARLIHRFARAAGLSDAEAQDVLQETLLVVARKMPGFRYDPARGSFKSWLLLIVRYRIHKQLRKRLPQMRSGRDESDESKRTSPLDRVPDTRGSDLDALWESEWKQNLWSAAVSRVKAQFKPKQFQMFDLYVLKEWPVKEVALALGVSTTHIYVIKHRISLALKSELARLSRDAGTELAE
jgi:RNA polymerase sigma factor (sigma-70 family)